MYKEQDWWQTLNQKLAAYDTFMDVYGYVGKDIAALFENEKTTAFDTAYSTYTLDKLADYYLSLDAEGRAQFDAEIAEVEAYNDYVADSGVYTSLTLDEALNEKLRALAIEIIYAEPLPETGLTQKINGEEYDYTDILARQAMQYTVGDVASMVYATIHGDVVIDYGHGIPADHDQLIAYVMLPEDGDPSEIEV